MQNTISNLLEQKQNELNQALVEKEKLIHQMASPTALSENAASIIEKEDQVELLENIKESVKGAKDLEESINLYEKHLEQQVASITDNNTEVDIDNKKTVEYELEVLKNSKSDLIKQNQDLINKNHKADIEQEKHDYVIGSSDFEGGDM